MFSFWKKQLVLPIMIGTLVVGAASSTIKGADTRRRRGLRRTSRGMNRRLSTKNANTCTIGPFTVPDTSKLGAEIFRWTPATTGKSPKSAKSAKAHKIADNGIGNDSFNKYAWSSALDDDGCIYVGTFNINFNLIGLPAFIEQFDGPLDLLTIWTGSPATYSEGGAIYKICGDDVKLVHKAGHDHVGFRKGINYNGDMYFSSANSRTGAKVFTNAGNDDDTFTILDSFTDAPQLLPSDHSIRAMCTSASGKLYMGTENFIEGAGVLSYNANDGTWSRYNISTFAVAECTEVTSGFMLFGTWNGMGFTLHLYDESSDIWGVVTNPGALEPEANGVMQLDIVGDYLYLGTVSYSNGFGYARIQITDVSFTTLSSDWEIITVDGFYTEQGTQADIKARNPYPWSTAVVGDKYYIGTFAGLINTENAAYGPLDTRAQLWSTDVVDGTTWTIEEDDAFGEAYSYGFRTMQPGPDGSLYIGTASNLFFLDATRAPYTDYFTGTSELGNEGICHLIEDFGNRLVPP
jgi:hypothetical protein